jgi:hypothetical protein
MVLSLELDKNKVNLPELQREASQYVAAKFNSAHRVIEREG